MLAFAAEFDACLGWLAPQVVRPIHRRYSQTQNRGDRIIFSLSSLASSVACLRYTICPSRGFPLRHKGRTSIRGHNYHLRGTQRSSCGEQKKKNRRQVDGKARACVSCECVDVLCMRRGSRQSASFCQPRNTQPEGFSSHPGTHRPVNTTHSREPVTPNATGAIAQSVRRAPGQNSMKRRKKRQRKVKKKRGRAWRRSNCRLRGVQLLCVLQRHMRARSPWPVPVPVPVAVPVPSRLGFVP